MSEVTALPTEPQALPKTVALVILAKVLYSRIFAKSVLRTVLKIQVFFLICLEWIYTTGQGHRFVEVS